MEAPLSDDPVLITELSLHPHMVEGARDHFISCSVISDCLWSHGMYPDRSSVHGILHELEFHHMNFEGTQTFRSDHDITEGKNTEVGCHFLLQGIFLTQGLNPCLLCLLHCREVLYHWATGETPKATISQLKKKLKKKNKTFSMEYPF